MLDPGHLTDLAGLSQRLKQSVALRVHIGRDMMGDLSGGMAEAHPGIVRCGPDPQRPSRVVDLRRAPETHVMASRRVTPRWLLKRQVFFPPPEIEAAHGRIDVRPMQERAARDPEAALERER